MPDIAFPYRIDARGRTAETSRAAHIRDMIELVLFTAPGERVMRPDFGANLLASLFAPAGPEAAAALRVLAQSALQEHLRDVIEVQDLAVTSQDGTVTVRLAYAIIETGEPVVDEFRRAAP